MTAPRRISPRARRRPHAARALTLLEVVFATVLLTIVAVSISSVVSFIVRLQTDGAWFTNCYYPYGTTQTGPGHASMLTGTCPDKHGIVQNDWYDRSLADTVYCAGHPRYKLVPPAPKAAEADCSTKINT